MDQGLHPGMPATSGDVSALTDRVKRVEAAFAVLLRPTLWDTVLARPGYHTHREATLEEVRQWFTGALPGPVPQDQRPLPERVQDQLEAPARGGAVLVPVDPTREMVKAAMDTALAAEFGLGAAEVATIYRVMVAARRPMEVKS